MKKIHAVILAAGKGTRLNMPEQAKALLPVNDKPLILHTLATLSQLEIDSITIVVGYLGEQIIAAVSAAYPRVKFVWQKELNGTGGALRSYLVQSNIADDDFVLVMNADDSWKYSLDDLYKIITTEKSDTVSLFITNDAELKYSYYRKVILDEKANFLELTAQPVKGEYIVCGCFLATKQKFEELISQLRPESNGELGLPKVIELLPAKYVRPVIIPYSHWRGINTLDELNEARRPS